jgi:hypothetical protein
MNEFVAIPKEEWETKLKMLFEAEYNMWHGIKVCYNNKKMRYIEEFPHNHEIITIVPNHLPIRTFYDGYICKKIVKKVL